MRKCFPPWSGLCLALVILFFSCQTDSGPWADFTKCGANACVKEAILVKEAFLKDPKAMLGKFNATYQKGEDHVVGWLNLLRDSVLFNPAYGSTEERFAMQQAILEAARPFENDPVLGEMAKSVLGEIENLAIASEREDGPPEYVPVTGTFTFELEQENGSGELKTSVADAGQVKFSLLVLGGPPAHHQGMMEGLATRTAPGVFEYETTTYGGKCRLQFIADGEAITIKTLEGDAAACGFGNNISADNVYRAQNFDDPFLTPRQLNAAKKLQGQWVSASDPKSELRIENGLYTETYGGEPAGSLPYQYYPRCPKDCNPVAETPCLKVMGQDDVCYTVVKADGKTLELSPIGGTGNTLVFNKK